MRQDEYAFTIPSGKTIHAQSWTPDGSARAAVALVHGFGEHVGRYPHVAERFTAAGFFFAGFDLPGHGKTDTRHGHASLPLLLEAVGGHIEETRRRSPGVPLVLYGHSMGGALALRYCLERKPDLAAVIASSPLVRTFTPPPAIKAAAAKLLKAVLPGLILNNPLEPGALSRDPAVGEAAQKDPDCHNLVSARLGADLMENMRWLSSFKGAFPLPLLFMQGTADRIVNAEASLALAGNLQGDVTVKSWEGYYHELHNEPERNQVIDFMIDWLNRRVPAVQPR